MAINMRALYESLTPVTPDQAEEAMAESLETHRKKYGPPSKDAICLESPDKVGEDVQGESGDKDAPAPA